jgi:hypothetical protein
VRTCTVIEDGVKCEKRHWGNGYCRMHNARYLRHGDPLFVVGFRVEKPSYFGAHCRVKGRRGSASRYECECGAAAQQWAYDHADPNELTEAVVDQRGQQRLVKYSASIDHYIPMCKPCHVQFDKGLIQT